MGLERLQAIGFWYWRSHRLAFLGYPDPVRLVDPGWRPDLRARIVEYLQTGTMFSVSGGFSHCRFDGCRYSEWGLGSRDLTDGVWVWPEGLAHYVEEHLIRLPDELVDDVVERDFAQRPLRLRSYELDFWLRWSAEQPAAPPPEDGACSVEDARAIGAAIVGKLGEARIVPDGARWHVAVVCAGETIAEVRCEPLAGATLRTYLERCVSRHLEQRAMSKNRARPVDEHERALLDEIFPVSRPPTPQRAPRDPRLRLVGDTCHPATALAIHNRIVTAIDGSDLVVFDPEPERKRLTTLDGPLRELVADMKYTLIADPRGGEVVAIARDRGLSVRLARDEDAPHSPALTWRDAYWLAGRTLRACQPGDEPRTLAIWPAAPTSNLVARDGDVAVLVDRSLETIDRAGKRRTLATVDAARVRLAAAGEWLVWLDVDRRALWRCDPNGRDLRRLAVLDDEPIAIAGGSADGGVVVALRARDGHAILRCSLDGEVQSIARVGAAPPCVAADHGGYAYTDGREILRADW